MTEFLLPFLGVFMLVLGVSAGVGLFIFGLRRKKPAMWAAGIVLCLLGAVPVAAGYMSIRAEGRRQVQAVKDESAREDIKEWTGLAFPHGVSVRFRTQHGLAFGNEVKEYTQYEFSAPPDFDKSLPSQLTKAQWQDVALVFQGGRRHPQSTLPTDSQLQAMSLYKAIRPGPNADQRSITAVAYDPSAGQAWVVIAFERAPPGPPTTSPPPPAPRGSGPSGP